MGGSAPVGALVAARRSARNLVRRRTMSPPLVGFGGPPTPGLWPCESSHPRCSPASSSSIASPPASLGGDCAEVRQQRLMRRWDGRDSVVRGAELSVASPPRPIAQGT